MVSENIPVIIGAGQVTKKEAATVNNGSPVDLMVEAVNHECRLPRAAA